eukprot:Rhum_TRINITY_DN6272_c0_g2::Rhum_TRINITY_DN6272_c0_g2_i1::g.19551::m.19551
MHQGSSGLSWVCVSLPSQGRLLLVSTGVERRTDLLPPRQRVVGLTGVSRHVEARQRGCGVHGLDEGGHTVLLHEVELDVQRRQLADRVRCRLSRQQLCQAHRPLVRHAVVAAVEHTHRGVHPHALAQRRHAVVADAVHRHVEVRQRLVLAQSRRKHLRALVAQRIRADREHGEGGVVDEHDRQRLRAVGRDAGAVEGDLLQRAVLAQPCAQQLGAGARDVVARDVEGCEDVELEAARQRRAVVHVEPGVDEREAGEGGVQGYHVGDALHRALLQRQAQDREGRDACVLRHRRADRLHAPLRDGAWACLL